MSALSAAVEKCLSQMSLSSLQIWRVRSLHLEKPKRILRPTAVDAIGVCARSTARLTHTHLTPLHASHVQLADIAAFPVAANFNRTTALATVRSGRCPTCPTSGRPSPRPRAARSSQRRAPRVKPLGLLLSRRHMPRRRSASDRRVSMHRKVLPRNGLLYSSPLFRSQSPAMVRAARSH